MASSDVATGHFGPYGGRFVPEALTAALDGLDTAFAQAMADHRRQHRLHVLGHDMAASQQQRVRARRAQQCEPRARGQAHPDPGLLATTCEQGLYVGQQGFAGVHAEHRAAQRDHPVGIEQGGRLRDQVASVAAGEQGAFGGLVGIAKREPQQEAVEL